MLIRAVVDTNVLISGFFWKGPPRLVFESALNQRFIAVTSEDVLAELMRVLDRPKFDKQLQQQNLTRAGLIAAIRSISVLAEPAPVGTDAIRDPKDRMILACAVGARVDYIVSGDQDLQVLGTYDQIPILSPVEFLAQLSKLERET